MKRTESFFSVILELFQIVNLHAVTLTVSEVLTFFVISFIEIIVWKNSQLFTCLNYEPYTFVLSTPIKAVHPFLEGQVSALYYWSFIVM